MLWDLLLVKHDALTVAIVRIIVESKIRRTMYIKSTIPSGSIGLMPILNCNHITEEKQKEAIKAMGMSACQVRCLSHQCNGHYHSRH